MGHYHKPTEEVRPHKKKKQVTGRLIYFFVLQPFP